MRRRIPWMAVAVPATLMCLSGCFRFPIVEWTPDYTSDRASYWVSETEFRAKQCYSSRSAAEGKVRRKAKRQGYDDAVLIECVSGFAGLGCVHQWKCTGFGATRATP